MDPVHRRVLANKTTRIMNRITSPTVFSAYLSPIFSSSDMEEIRARENTHGATHGTQSMLSLLEKRGPKAFGLFITALRDPGNQMDDLAEELMEEERKLRGRTGPPNIPKSRSLDMPVTDPYPVDLHGDPENDFPPPPYSASVVQPISVGNNNGMTYNLSSGQTANPSQPPNVEMNNEMLRLDTLVKDIPYRLRLQIEKLLDPPDANHHDWRGMASVMKLSADDVRQLESTQENGKMKGLIEKMIQLKKTVNDLLVWLKHPELERWDVIDEIKKFENDIPEELLSPEKESSEDQSSDSSSVTSPVEETCTQESKSKLCSVPQQEHGEEPDDEKPDARIPSQVEESEDYPKENRDQRKVEDKDDLDLDNKPDYRMPSQEEQSDSITSVGDDDVFECTGEAKKEFHALLISCCGNNDKQDKKHDSELRNLEGILEESSWDHVKRETKCKVSNLIQMVHSFLKPCESMARRIVSFVYLVGPTVQINGENYLLPTDLNRPSSKADLIHSSLNINWLVKQLSKHYMQVVIVDGAYESATIKDIKLDGVLPGLAPIQPPPNAIIAFPCHPGIVRPEQERLAYIKSLVENLQQESNMMLADLFDRVRADLESKEAVSSPVEFSLTSSPQPICINPEEGQGLQVHYSGEIPCHAIIIANINCNYVLNTVETNQCIKDCEQLRMALLKTGWKCEHQFCDKSAKDIMEGLRKALNELADGKRRVVMLYFMGFTKTIMECNYFSGRNLEAFLSDPHSSGVPLQWALDLMCEKLQGPKILIVDDVTTPAANGREGLAEMIAPFDVMISLPTNSRQRVRSFTSNFARLLGENSGKLSLKDIVKKAALKDPHRLSSNLLDPKLYSAMK